MQQCSVFYVVRVQQHNVVGFYNNVYNICLQSKSFFPRNQLRARTRRVYKTGCFLLRPRGKYFMFPNLVSVHSSGVSPVENVPPAATLGDDDDEAVSPQSMEDSTAANYMNQTLLHRAVWNDDTDTVRLAVLTGHHYTRLSRVDIRKWWSSC